MPQPDYAFEGHLELPESIYVLLPLGKTEPPDSVGWYLNLRQSCKVSKNACLGAPLAWETETKKDRNQVSSLDNVSTKLRALRIVGVLEIELAKSTGIKKSKFSLVNWIITIKILPSPFSLVHQELLFFHIIIIISEHLLNSTK